MLKNYSKDQIHFVIFITSVKFGTKLVEREIDSWDPKIACSLIKTLITYPLGFYFETKHCLDTESNCFVTEKTSHMFFINGIISSLQELQDKNNPEDSILISQLKQNNVENFITVNYTQLTQDNNLLYKDKKYIEKFYPGDTIVDSSGIVIFQG
jgi:hypothetical protein